MGVRELKIWDIYHFVVLLTTWIGRNKKLHYSYSSRGCRISPPFNFFFLLYKINKGGIYAKQQHAKGTKNLNKLYTGLGSAPTYGVSERSLEVANTSKRRADVGADSYESRRVTPSASTQFRAPPHYSERHHAILHLALEDAHHEMSHQKKSKEENFGWSNYSLKNCCRWILDRL